MLSKISNWKYNIEVFEKFLSLNNEMQKFSTFTQKIQEILETNFKEIIFQEQ